MNFRASALWSAKFILSNAKCSFRTRVAVAPGWWMALISITSLVNEKWTYINNINLVGGKLRTLDSYLQERKEGRLTTRMISSKQLDHHRIHPDGANNLVWSRCINPGPSSPNYPFHAQMTVKRRNGIQEIGQSRTIMNKRLTVRSATSLPPLSILYASQLSG